MERQCEPEVMDDPNLESTRHQAALRGLARLNLFSASPRIVWAPIYRLAQRLSVDRLKVVDIATGGGDIPIRLWTWAKRMGLRLDFHGVDISPQAIEVARARAEKAGAEVTFSLMNVLDDPLPQDADVMICSLFFHHLDNAQAKSLLQKMSLSARHLVLISDLRRSVTGWLLAHAAARLLTTSDVVHIDAPLSAKAAFTSQEFRDLAEAAELRGAKVERRWPCRLLLSWNR